MLQLLATETYSIWLPQQASRNGIPIDTLFYFILGVTVFFSTLIMGLLIYFVLKYRHREGGKKHDPSGGHSTALELTWTIIPTILVLIIFWFGFRGYLHANTLPPNAEEITATGSMWNWSFTYGNGYTDPNLHLVVNRPVRMILQSNDVIHDLFVPAFRMKKDVVPGRFNREWFEPTQKGEFTIYCAMYCGTNHSTMMAKCIVQDQAEYDAWMREAENPLKHMSYIEHGKQLYGQMGCAQCHSVDGSKSTGPTWKDMYGTMVPCQGMGPVNIDDAYIKESIIYPAAKIVEGFQNVMPPGYGDRLKPADITSLTWYMKSISSHYTGDLAPGQKVNPEGSAAPAGPTIPGFTLPTTTSPATGPATNPGTTEPTTTSPSATEPATNPATTVPASNPTSTAPATTSPGTTEPATTSPATTGPTSSPSSTAPAATNPGTAPAATSPATTGPTSSPSSTAPATTNPGTTEPAATSPSSTTPANPGKTEPAATDPAKTEPSKPAPGTQDAK